MFHNISSLHSLTVEARLLFESSLSSLSGIDWTNETRLILIALLLGSIILVLEHYLFATRTYHRLDTWAAKYFYMPLSTPHPRAGPIYARPENPNDPNRRTVFTDTNVAIYGWPSRGGVIILEDATHVDFTFLGLSTTEPPLKRVRGDDSSDNAERDAIIKREDAFCQRLLLLGAKWWDSEARYRFISRVGAGIQPAIEDVESGRVEEAVLRERRWIRVGWEGAAAPDDHGKESGGFWVLDCDTSMHGVLEEENMVPDDAGRVGIARSLEERCEILRMLGARLFGRLEEYESRTTYLRAWEWKWEGEVGELVRL